MSAATAIVVLTLCALVAPFAFAQKIKDAKWRHDTRDKMLEIRETQLLLMAKGENLPEELIPYRLKAERDQAARRQTRRDPRFRDKAALLPQDAEPDF